MEKYHKIFRYIVSGGTAAVVNIGFLFLLTHFLHVWYVLSSIISFLVAFIVSFSLQKFWTFRDRATHDVHKQGGVYLIITSLNLCLNTGMIYCFVHFLHFNYIVAAIITGGMIALVSYFLYAKFVFNRA